MSRQQRVRYARRAPPNGVLYNDGLQDILMRTSNVPGNAGPGAALNSGPPPRGLPGPAPSPVAPSRRRT